MNPLFKKLNYKDQSVLLMVNSPESLEKDLKEMEYHANVVADPVQIREIEFAIVFVTRQAQIDELVPIIAPKLMGDAIVWFCYPKGSSKKYKCDFNRDKGWEIMGKFSLEGVRQVAVDEDWSALRFRNVKYIKSITRSESMALPHEARERTTKRGK